MRVLFIDDDPEHVSLVAELTEEILEGHAETIFSEAENRLHAQKAILAALGT